MPSPWPITSSAAAAVLATGAALYLSETLGLGSLIKTGFAGIIFVMFTWWRDIIREATLGDFHKASVQRGIRLGMLMFIASEIMFFFAFFWGFFHSSIAPSYNIGGIWPPKAITKINVFTIPLLNTILLINSGITITWSHAAFPIRAKKHGFVALACTIMLALIFIALQLKEYTDAPFNISDGIYGSCFFMTTGFHGFHVLIGTAILIVSFIRMILNHFTKTHHVGLICAIWYWHFVDAVWLFLFGSVYCWSNR